MKTRFALLCILLAVAAPAPAAEDKAATEMDKAFSRLERVLKRKSSVFMWFNRESRVLRFTKIVGLSGEKAYEIEKIDFGKTVTFEAEDLNLMTVTSVQEIFQNKWYGLRVTGYMTTEPVDWWLSRRMKESDATEAANALRLMALEAQREVDNRHAVDLADCRASAKVWREMEAKPEIPEEVYRRNVIAENAIKEKNFDKAAEEYAAALKQYPTWPQGRFNLAYIAGERKAYRVAILHMKCYLELVPDAPDARAARDRVIIWEDKIHTNLAQEIADSSAGSSRGKR
jgi:hypothetical protein